MPNKLTPPKHPEAKKTTPRTSPEPAPHAAPSCTPPPPDLSLQSAPSATVTITPPPVTPPTTTTTSDTAAATAIAPVTASSGVTPPPASLTLTLPAQSPPSNSASACTLDASSAAPKTSPRDKDGGAVTPRTRNRSSSNSKINPPPNAASGTAADAKDKEKDATAVSGQTRPRSSSRSKQPAPNTLTASASASDGAVASGAPKPENPVKDAPKVKCETVSQPCRRYLPLTGEARELVSISPGTVVEVNVKVDASGKPSAVLAGPPLALPGSAKAAAYAIACARRLDPVFSEEVMAHTRHLIENPGFGDPKLRDLTGLAFITMDNEDSRDLDQAMFIRMQGKEYNILYALADASYYITPGTPLFQEAMKRNTSYYLPGMCIPMLPKELSEGLISLNPGELRRSLVFDMTINDEGLLTRTEVYRALIRSRRKLTYEGVQQYHDDKLHSPLSGQDFTETLDLLQVVGDIRIAEASRRNVVSFHRSAVSVHAGIGPGGVFEMAGDARFMTERWNEQISLLCNIAGGALLLGGGVSGEADEKKKENLQGIWRVHAAPPPERLQHLQERIEKIVAAHSELPSDMVQRFLWKRAENDFGFSSTPPGREPAKTAVTPVSEPKTPLESNPPTEHTTPPSSEPASTTKPPVQGETLSAYLSRLPLEGPYMPISKAIHRAAMMTNVASELDRKPGIHYGVGAQCYARFSSPMREMVGIFVHKQACDFLGLQPASAATAEQHSDEQLCKHVVYGGNNAKLLQSQLVKDTNRLAIDHVLGADLLWPSAMRPLRAGIILGISVDKSRFFVQLENPPIEVKVYLNHLDKAGGDLFQIDQSAVSISNASGDVFSVGDQILVRVVSGGCHGVSDVWVLEPVRPKHHSKSKKTEPVRPKHHSKSKKTGTPPASSATATATASTTTPATPQPPAESIVPASASTPTVESISTKPAVNVISPTTTNATEVHTHDSTSTTEKKD
ncbi:Ribonuclease R [Pelomyxa schiedti]|nr:Ribonuclease R [Pelomyxa schiedti]